MRATENGRALPPRPSLLVGTSDQCAVAWGPLKAKALRFLSSFKAVTLLNDSAQNIDEGSWDHLVFQLRSLRESLISNGMLEDPQYLSLATEVYELSVEVCAVAMNYPELLKCLQVLVGDLHSSHDAALAVAALDNTGLNARRSVTSSQGQNNSRDCQKGVTSSKQHSSQLQPSKQHCTGLQCNTTNSSPPCCSDAPTAGLHQLPKITAADSAGLSDEQAHTATPPVTPSRHAEFKAAKLLFFSCVPEKPSRLDILTVLRDILPHTTIMKPAAESSHRSSEQLDASSSRFTSSVPLVSCEERLQPPSQGDQQGRCERAELSSQIVMSCQAASTSSQTEPCRHIISSPPDACLHVPDPLGCVEYAISVLRAMSRGDAYRVLQLSQQPPTWLLKLLVQPCLLRCRLALLTSLITAYKSIPMHAAELCLFLKPDYVSNQMSPLPSADIYHAPTRLMKAGVEPEKAATSSNSVDYDISCNSFAASAPLQPQSATKHPSVMSMMSLLNTLSNNYGSKGAAIAIAALSTPSQQRSAAAGSTVQHSDSVTTLVFKL
ncbi:hypothetical protein CEUSTIGMA_g10256.t1 [Chlamydomonas eustigma]|uniref:Uncharacterized protein n=1 Tax=Chlamydomonas eustigma TaxID=1157962 RepID=A0A250XJ54_9CHLO|nr:hypothetical protein CEUSTIGMA_g10256.t1 [Chlamydomonas eustigma]|eukprot:GAX82830.1 hypothetical protein CEUSTIGMA_g10256.t1 [Chlamydomonas eustigma]